MKMYKNFKLYQPADEAVLGLYLRDTAGNDWYECQRDFQSDTCKIIFSDTGLVVACEVDASLLFPVGCSVAEISVADCPDGFAADGTWRFIDGKLEKIPPDYAAQAEAKKTKLLTAAAAAIAPLQDAVELGIATDEEAALLTAWKKYRVLLNRVDTSKAPDIEWPERPA
jgi:hypothetical protein